MDLWAAVLKLMISIHALRVEGDFRWGWQGSHFVRISIHALRVEGDEVSDAGKHRRIKFLSTPSGWRATVSIFYNPD